MDEFLFGDQDDSLKLFQDISRKVDSKGNSLKFILFYLSPADYHRYHSPALWSTNFRRHIAGKLHPVKPSYVANHPNVFKENERVSLCGDWANGFFSTTFIGATNVGSIALNFDPELETNTVRLQEGAVSDKVYFNDICSSKILPQNLQMMSSLRMMPQELCEYSNTKDNLIKDCSDSKSCSEESSTATEDSISGVELDINQDDKSKSFLNSHNKVATIESENQQYDLTPNGFLLSKGQEVGYFNLGSSIMLIFEAPKEAEFEVSVGQKVSLGNNIMNTVPPK